MKEKGKRKKWDRKEERITKRVIRKGENLKGDGEGEEIRE